MWEGGFGLQGWELVVEGAWGISVVDPVAAVEIARVFDW
jgi:hypothetical protein